MSEFLKNTGAAVIVVAIFASAVTGIAYGSYELYAFFAPKYQAVNRDVMINSRQYDEATVRELYRMKRQWAVADPAARATIEASARHEFEIFPKNRLPPDLQVWAQQIGVY